MHLGPVALSKFAQLHCPPVSSCKMQLSRHTDVAAQCKQCALLVAKLGMKQWFVVPKTRCFLQLSQSKVVAKKAQNGTAFGCMSPTKKVAFCSWNKADQCKQNQALFGRKKSRMLRLT